MIKIEAYSDLKNIIYLRNMVASLCVNKNTTLSFINEVKTLVSEGVTNAIVHGYDGEETGLIILTCSVKEEGLYLTIEDFGIGIEDIEQAKEVLFTTKVKEERSGLGLTVLEMFSSDFKIESTVLKGTKLSIFKEWE